MNKKYIVRVGLILTIFSIMALTACGRQGEQRYSKDYLVYFDTVTRVISYAGNEDEFKKQADFIEERLKFYHENYSGFDSYPDVNNIHTINKNAGIKPVVVDDTVLDMLEFSKAAYYETKGRVNIAMGPVTLLWNNYRLRYQDMEVTELPSEKDLKAAASHTDIENLVIDRINHTAYLKDKDARLDVGAIAKGYAGQRIADEARAEGIGHMLISLGGNVVAIGSKLDENSKPEKWQVGVQNPDTSSKEEITPSLKLSDMALVSSGDYERFYLYKGERYAHIIDPASLYPPRQFREVTIVTKDSGKADVYSTALFIMSLEEGKSFIEATDAEAMWVLADGRVEYSKGFRAYEK